MSPAVSLTERWISFDEEAFLHFEHLLEIIYQHPKDKDLELILRITKYLEHSLRLDKVNFLFDCQNLQMFLQDKTGVLVPIQVGEGNIQNAWHLDNGLAPVRLDPVEMDHLAIAGHMLSLALENIHLRREVIVDALTKVYNRQHFDRMLQHEMDRSKRYSTPFSMLLLDIDHFKEFNDTYGHLVGDEVLKSVAKVLRDNTRSSDMVFRYGGEEFAVILPHLDIRYATKIAERLKKHVDGTMQTAEKLRTSIMNSHLNYKGQELPVYVSIGITTYAGTEKNITIPDLIKRADEALYRAKEMGRNRSEVMGKSERLRILIVDNSEMYCRLLKDFFESRGYSVITATGGMQAIEKIHNEYFDLVLLDIQMPGMTGVQVLERVQKDSKRMKIVALTAVHDEKVRQLCFDYGACEYLEKPISLEFIEKNLMARILEMKA